MKRFFGVLLTVLIVVLSGCTAENPTADGVAGTTPAVTAERQYVPSTITDEDLLEDVRLTVTPAVVTDSAQEIDITVTNTSDNNDYIYGEFTYLDVLIDGKWVEYPLIEGVQWHMIAYLCEPGTTTEIPGNIQWLYGELPAGRYRLAKNFQRNDSTVPRETVGCAVAEFEVKP